MIHTYKIKELDTFIEQLYPNVVEEVIGIRKRSAEMKSPHKADIIVSFLKDHSIKSEWLQTNKDISKLMTSGSLNVSHLESLFGSCRQNAIFLSGLESYIKSSLA
jgi:hypothetical protein